MRFTGMKICVANVDRVIQWSDGCVVPLSLTLCVCSGTGGAKGERGQEETRGCAEDLQGSPVPVGRVARCHSPRGLCGVLLPQQEQCIDGDFRV
jgi:hypothetical protein